MADRKKGNSSKTPLIKGPPPPGDDIPFVEPGLDLLSGLWRRFGRFGWDAAGVLLLALALLILLGLFNLTQGDWLSRWVFYLRQGFGWGAILVAATSAAAGVFALSRRRRPPGYRVRMGRLLALEGAAFALLALLSILGGSVLGRAEAGLDGGLIGWGLAELPVYLGISPLIRTIAVVTVLVVFLVIGFGITDLLSSWVDRRLGTETTSQPAPPPVLLENIQSIPQPGVSEPEPAPKNEPVRAARAQPIPAEFRKTFKVQPAETEKPIAPRPRDERLPPLNLLLGEQSSRPDERHINQTAGLIEKTMSEFGIPARVVGFRVGPTVTQFAVEPGFVEKPGPDGSMQKQKVRVSQISALSRDLALALSAERLRIEAPVPGRSYVGIEVPNARSSLVRLRSILESDAFQKIPSPLAVALGRDVSGQPVVADLARMPHLLIAGTTGSGKSVCIEALTACLVANNTPESLRLVMVDPKMVELVRFNGLPHLLGKVETDLERILAVLRWILAEMDHRYRLLESVHARDLNAYNQKMERRKGETLPRIVLLIDELADLMMSAPDQTEHSLVRLAQMARATGIHLVVATQRPSTDVVTGLIKANFPARISFTVASSIDSRVVLDTSGAETLLGRGDMLFLNPETGAPLRAQGVLVTDQEVERIISHWQKVLPPPPGTPPAPWEALMQEGESGSDALIEQAVSLIRGMNRVSTSLLQRRLRIGYPRAARLMDELEELGAVGPSQGGGRDREVLIEPEEDTGGELDDEAA